MASSIIYRYLNFRTLGLVLFYTLVSASSYWIAYELRFDFDVPEYHVSNRIETIWWVVGLQCILLFACGQVDSILSYFRLPDVLRLFTGLFFNSLILLSMWYIYNGVNVPPRAVILTYFLLSFLSISGFRVFMRIKSSQGIEDWLTMDEADNVLIVGAGEVGAGLCVDLINKSRLGMRPVAFLDDDPKKIGRYVHGIFVADRVEQVADVAKRFSASKVIIAFPSASVKRVKKIAELAREAGLTVETVPALTDLVSGRAELSQLRPIQLEDLLGRDTIDLDSEEILTMLRGKRVLVTGAGGSIGRELVAQILSYEPSKIICIDQTEIAIFNLLQEELALLPASITEVSTIVLDVLNAVEMEKMFRHYQPEVIFHAAAHKHVNLMEQQPAEAVRNNFFATSELARIASEHMVERFILISTDKAINPTSVMGASKRLAELSIQAQQVSNGNKTQFISVRFGNVLGSSGSVIPIFRKQIANGGPITVTDPEVTRFFMTVSEAVGLVLQSATQGKGGEIFVLDMGESVKIVDVARQMIGLSGLREGHDIEIVFTGLRPGEKLYEEVQHISECLQATRHPRILRFSTDQEESFNTTQQREELELEISNGDANAIKKCIQKYVPEYTPSEPKQVTFN